MANIFEIKKRILSGETTAVEETEAALRLARDNEDYHALLSLTEERALVRAAEIDEKDCKR